MPPVSDPDPKQELRRVIRRARRLRAEAGPTDHGDGLRRLLDRLGARTIAAFLPSRTEPDVRPVLHAWLADGHRALLPRVLPDHRLGWVDAAHATERPSALGVPEAIGPTAHRAALRDVDAIVVPALAVAPDGTRLGQGGGYYDRALADPAVTAPVIAVVFDDEVRADLPGEPHDRPADWAVTERRVLRLGRG